MSYTLVFHPQSEEEYNQSYQWYEAEQKGLGTRFEKEVAELLQKIEAAPDTYRLDMVVNLSEKLPLKTFLL